MTDNRLCYSILLLIDNTAGMKCTTFESFPFVSFAKSIAKSIIERSRSTKIRLIVVYSDPSGNPKSVYLNLTQPNIQFPLEISQLAISPGKFDETVQEGLIQFNKMRYQSNPKELVDPYFFPKKVENYSILLFTDGSYLSHDFYKFQAVNEYLIRPDENIYFCNICRNGSIQETTKKNLMTIFSQAYEQLDIEPITFFTPYSGSNKLMDKLFYPTCYFHFCLNFGSIVVKSKISLTNLLWPFPYDPSVNPQGNVLPQYHCIYFDKPINVKRIKHTKYEITVKSEDIQPGNYVIYDSLDNGASFAILVYENEHATLKLLPYNFMNLLQIMNPYPSKSALDAYVASLPPPYYEGIVTFFKENGFEFSNIVPKSKKEHLKRLRDREEFFNAHIQDNYISHSQISLDPSRFSYESLSSLLETMPKARKSFSVKKSLCKITINKDTIDDEKTFQSLEIVLPKIRPTIIYQRTQSPIQDSFVKSIMPRLKTSTAEEKITEIANITEMVESIFEEDSETDNITMLEDLLMLLRDRESYELERRLKKMKENTEFFSFVKNFLLNSIKRFKIENLPQSLIALLNSSDNA